VEGAEQAILETIPWDKVDIQTFLIEVKTRKVFKNVMVTHLFNLLFKE
jgi:hypothetical protein